METSKAPDQQASEQLMHFSAKNFFFGLAVLVLLFAMAKWAESVLLPFTFSIVLAFIFMPVVKFFERFRIGRVLSIIISFLLVLIVVGGIFFFFSAQIVKISSEFTAFKTKMLEMYQKGLLAFDKTFGSSLPIETTILIERAKIWVNATSGSIIATVLSKTSNILSDIAIIPVYLFLLLLYRTGIRKTFVRFFKPENQVLVNDMMLKVQEVGQKYVFGIVVLILVLGILNTIALVVIGIEYALFFGFLAAVLAVIPYVGTLIGAVLPIVYSLVHYESFYQPLAIAGAFTIIQLIDGNFLTPKILGSGINLNPLTSILALLVGANVWGISGMILFVPLAAIIKIICQYFYELQPIALLMDEKLYESGYSGEDWWHRFRKSTARRKTGR